LGKREKVSANLEIFKLDFQSDDWELRALQSPFMGRAAAGFASLSRPCCWRTCGTTRERERERERERDAGTTERKNKKGERKNDKIMIDP
jgi:hypothetical protein